MYESCISDKGCKYSENDLMWPVGEKPEENSELSASVCLFFNEDEMSSEDNMFQKSPLDTNYHFYGEYPKSESRLSKAKNEDVSLNYSLCDGFRVRLEVKRLSRLMIHVLGPQELRNVC